MFKAATNARGSVNGPDGGRLIHHRSWVSSRARRAGTHTPQAVRHLTSTGQGRYPNPGGTMKLHPSPEAKTAPHCTARRRRSCHAGEATASGTSTTSKRRPSWTVVATGLRHASPSSRKDWNSGPSCERRPWSQVSGCFGRRSARASLRVQPMGPLRAAGGRAGAAGRSPAGSSRDRGDAVTATMEGSAFEDRAVDWGREPFHERGVGAVPESWPTRRVPEPARQRLGGTAPGAAHMPPGPCESWAPASRGRHAPFPGSRSGGV